MVNSEKLEKGRRMLRQLLGGEVKSEVFSAMEEVFPAFWEMTQEWLFGEIWSGPCLSLRERLIATIAALQALVCVDELKAYMRYAHNTGMSVDEILEIIKHVMNYSGWPSGVNGLVALTEVFPTNRRTEVNRIDPEKFKRGQNAQRDFWGSTLHERSETSRGEFHKIVREVYGDHHNKMITEHLFGDVWYRPGLAQQEKTVLLITVSSTVVFDYDAVLRSRAGLVNNLEGALHQGISREEILEIIMEIAHYSGWPAAYNALLVAKDVFASTNVGKGKMAGDTQKDGKKKTLSDTEKYEKGKKILQQQLQGGKGANDFTEELFPDFWKMTMEHLFGEVWSRPGLSLRKRIIISLAANMTLKFNFGLEESMRWALHNGFSREEILDAIIEVAHLRGWPAGINAILVAKAVFASRDM